MVTSIQLYKDFNRESPFFFRSRNWVRDSIVFLLSIGRNISDSSGWIRFPYYHHIFDDERRGFAQQLDYFKCYGDFISLTDAVVLLKKKEKISGRYFCLTFDDGFLNNFTNAVPILVEKKATATFFLPTDYIGRTLEKDLKHLSKFFGDKSVVVEFLNWEHCRQMLSCGMEIGSHSVHHLKFSKLKQKEIIEELEYSKREIEANLKCECTHFCAPFGIPNMDFNPDRDSLLATQRPSMYSLACWDRFFTSEELILLALS